jgi:ATP-dependent helicase HepA
MVEESDQGGLVRIRFPAAGELRVYALESAALARVEFGVGDVISGMDGESLVVEEVALLDGGLLAYRGGETWLAEAGLNATLDFIRPEKRLLAGLVDHPRDFDQRLGALEWNARIRKSPARGFAGARMELIPHQLAVVAAAAERLHPRLLLADEVGLGKTIEACLILHGLHLGGRADRVLILVPEPLIHQWFIELLRRFNLRFAIFDEDRCQAVEAHDAGCNPFLDSQLILCPLDFLAENAPRSEQALAAGFDLLIVDEAHHLEWEPDRPSAAYALVEALAGQVPSLLLLTATPRQLGPGGHFSRLRLLDPERYPDRRTFLEETKSHVPLAEAVECLMSGGFPEKLKPFMERSPKVAALAGALLAGDESVRTGLVAALIDLCGTGRVMFRNTRDRLTGFPVRHAHLVPLENARSPYEWLATLLRTLGEAEKVLLITGSVDAAVMVREKLLGEIDVDAALFHEELTLLQRDRNAAWFADPEGARILICSEIGSEGRNFQFARHLVLFGLPRDPELLEQRIGRLDRIGQGGEIHIHVPHGVNDRSETHAKWLNEGLDAFPRPLKGAGTLAEILLPELDRLNEGPINRKFEEFLDRSRTLKQQVKEELTRGHDRLLELGAPAPEKATTLLEAIRDADQDAGFERFAIRLFDHLGLEVTELSKRTYHFNRGHRHVDCVAGLPEDGIPATFDRRTALGREDLAFFTIDHPLLLDAMEAFLTGQGGNASFARWNAGKGKALILDCAFVMEVTAPRCLQTDRFLPPEVLRVTVDHHGRPLHSLPPPALLQGGNPRQIVHQAHFRTAIFPTMLQAARALADQAAADLRQHACAHAASVLDAEILRIKDLQTRCGGVNDREIDVLETRRIETTAALSRAKPRLDAMRLILRT